MVISNSEYIGHFGYQFVQNDRCSAGDNIGHFWWTNGHFGSNTGHFGNLDRSFWEQKRSFRIITVMFKSWIKICADTVYPGIKFDNFFVWGNESAEEPGDPNCTMTMKDDFTGWRIPYGDCLMTKTEGNVKSNIDLLINLILLYFWFIWKRKESYCRFVSWDFHHSR